MSEPPAIFPTAEAKQAAKRLARQIEWSEGFWLAYLFTIDANQAEFVRARVHDALAERGRELHLLRPETPEQLRLDAVLAQPDVGCSWIAAIREPDARGGTWTDAWMQLILRGNERRELLRERLEGGLVLVLHPALKPEVRAAGPDLWSIRTAVFELPPGVQPTSIHTVQLPLATASTPRFVDTELLDADLARWPEIEATLPELERCEALLALDERLRGTGRYDEAAAMSERLLSTMRTLARAQPEAGRSLFTRALDARAADLANLGREADAVEILDELVDLLRASVVYEGDVIVLASALGRLGALASRSGQHERAKSTLREAIDWLRKLLATTSDKRVDHAARGVLASTLNQLGTLFLDRGRFIDALEPIREASELVRPLADVDPENFGHVLPGILNNLSWILSALDRNEEALETARESVERFRGRVRDGMENERADLARSLYNLGQVLGEFGRRKEAVEATREAVEILDTAVDGGARAVLPALATTLIGHGGRLYELGDRAEARDAAQRAVTILRELERQGHPSEKELAAALTNLGLTSDGKEALTAYSEAVERLRSVATSDQPILRKNLAVALSRLGGRLVEQGRRDEALDVAREAVEIHRQLAGEFPEHRHDSLASALTNLSLQLAERGADAEAVALSEEAVVLLRGATGAALGETSSRFATALSNLGNQLSKWGRHERALAASTEAVKIRRRLAEVFPGAHLPELAASLVNLGSILSTAGKPDRAVSVTREALDICRELEAAQPGDYKRELGIALHNLARNLLTTQAWADMERTAREAVDLRRELATCDDPVSRHQLAQSLTLLAEAEKRLGEVESAVETYAGALRLLNADTDTDEQLAHALRAELESCCKTHGLELPSDLA